MAAPKRKTSRTRRDMRRTHQKIKQNYSHKCPNCNEIFIPHRMCQNCGFYKGREIKKIEA